MKFNYDGEKVFELRAKNRKDRDEWVNALEFLINLKDKLGNMGTDRTASTSSFFSDSQIVENKIDKNPKGKKSYRYSNIGKEELMGIMEDEDDQVDLLGDSKDHQKSEAILRSTGIWDYISNIPENLRKNRIMYGFFNKPNRTKLKLERKRWIFLISSRPLSREEYLEDQEEISEDELPPLLNFDVLYYYKSGYKSDEVVLAGEIKILDMDNVEIKTDQKANSYSFIVEAKGKKYQFISSKRYIIEQWVDAIKLSAKTAKEKQYSITGKVKNISMIVAKFEIDRDQLKEELENEVDRQLCEEDLVTYKEFEQI